MTTQRKVRRVRKDFDPTKEYSVDVSGCSTEEKKEVQQAFFDVGILWRRCGHTYQCFGAAKYTNAESSGNVTKNLMYKSTAIGCNMTPEEFLNLVYEPEEKGHVHAELMAQYAEDAKTHPEPWKLWQKKTECLDWLGWTDCTTSPAWDSSYEYRRKPKTRIIHGKEIPDLSFTPSVNEYYYFICLSSDQLFRMDYHSEGCKMTKLRAARGLCYPHTEEGKQAAILHAIAMLGTS